MIENLIKKHEIELDTINKLMLKTDVDSPDWNTMRTARSFIKEFIGELKSLKYSENLEKHTNKHDSDFPYRPLDAV